MERREGSMQTKRDMQQLAVEMIGAVLKFQSREGAECRLGWTSARYGERVGRMESFLRPLFGLAPLTAGGSRQDQFWEQYRQGIIHGTDPRSPEYWGDLKERDQRQVELASLGIAMILQKDKIWDPLSEKEKDQLSAWLCQVNSCELAKNNWLFFPVMVNLGLKHVGRPYDGEVMEKALTRIEECYLGDGWYSDGKSRQRDYYIAFAMHFYGLLYSVFQKEDDRERAGRFRERAARFGKDFIYWFASRGEALPFGRSLTYRFAMCAYWSAMAYAGVEAVSWGTMRGIIFRNIRWWLQKPIFTEDNLLTIGYGYPNLKMAEFYNGPGSPAWAMKAFLVLALPDSHPFWTAGEEELPQLRETVVQKHPYMILMRSQGGSHVQALTSGQYAAFEPTWMAEKYEKFAYSTLFGFSVPGGDWGLEQAAADSMLALCEEGDNSYRVRRKCEKLRINGGRIYSQWRPWPDVTVSTWLIPCSPWHIRVHHIVSGRRLTGAEGAYSVPWGYFPKGAEQTPEAAGAGERVRILAGERGIGVFCRIGGSGIINLSGERKGLLIEAHPNTNLLYPNTVIPTLKGEILEGGTWLCSLVLGEAGSSESEKIWEQPPAVSLDEEKGELSFGPESVRLALREDEEWESAENF